MCKFLFSQDFLHNSVSFSTLGIDKTKAVAKENTSRYLHTTTKMFKNLNDDVRCISMSLHYKHHFCDVVEQMFQKEEGEWREQQQYVLCRIWQKTKEEEAASARSTTICCRVSPTSTSSFHILQKQQYASHGSSLCSRRTHIAAVIYSRGPEQSFLKQWQQLLPPCTRRRPAAAVTTTTTTSVVQMMVVF